VFLASYPAAPPGPLKDTAFLYDNAAAAIALTGCGEPAKAQRITDAILYALDHDRFWQDGRLRNAALAGAVGAGPLKLPGWWDPVHNLWVEDRYQVGSDVGNMAWAMLALLTSADPKARAGAKRIGAWVAGWEDHRGAGGFTGGTFAHEPHPEVIAWKSTEHNTDLTAAFTRLGGTAQATSARHFVEAMWNPACACFATGSGEDGVSVNPLLALDAQIWPLLALPGAVKGYGSVLGTVEKRLKVGAGYAYSQAGGGVWTEGTAQVGLLQALLGQDVKGLAATIAAAQAPDGGFYASDVAELPTGFMLQTDPSKPRIYPRLSHLGATAWVALFEARFNPFTGTHALPIEPAADRH
jgi:hypothetical protein